MGVFDELKSVGKILHEAGKLEQYQQILDAMEKMLDMQKNITDLEDENKSLKAKLTFQEDFIFERNAYWIVKDDKKDGPYCSCCWDDQKKAIRMQPCGNPAYFTCPKCENERVEIYPEKDIPSEFHVFKPNNYR